MNAPSKTPLTDAICNECCGESVHVSLAKAHRKLAEFESQLARWKAVAELFAGWKDQHGRYYRPSANDWRNALAAYEKLKEENRE